MKKYQIRQGFIKEEVIGEVILRKEIVNFDLVIQPVKSARGDYFEVVKLRESTTKRNDDSETSKETANIGEKGNA